MTTPPHAPFAPFLTQCSPGRARQLVYRGRGAQLLVNRDPSSTVILGADEGMTQSQVIQILDPLGSASFDGNYDIWALAVSGMPVVQTVPGGTSQHVTIAQSANLFPAPVQTLPVGTTSTPVLPVANWSSLALNIRASTTGAAKVQVHHWADAAGTILVGGDSWPVLVGTQLTVITPLRGPYVSIDITVTSAGAMQNANTYCAFRADGADRISFPVGVQNGGVNSRTIPISGTDFWGMPSICAGHAFLKFVPFDTAGKLHLRIFVADELRNFLYYLADYFNPTTALNTLLVVPDQNVSIEVDNQDTTATHQYDVQLVVPPQ